MPLVHVASLVVRLHRNIVEHELLPRVHPAFPSSELQLVCSYHLDLEVVLEFLKEIGLFKQVGPRRPARSVEKLVTDGDTPHKLILHT